MAYQVYASNWFKLNPEFPNGIEPDGWGDPKTICYADTEQEAVAEVDKWNRKHPEGRLRRRASYRYIHANDIRKTRG